LPAVNPLRRSPALTRAIIVITKDLTCVADLDRAGGPGVEYTRSGPAVTVSRRTRSVTAPRRSGRAVSRDVRSSRCGNRHCCSGNDL